MSVTKREQEQQIELGAANMTYCESKNILEIMQGLMQALVVKQPIDPVKYLVKLLDCDKSMEEILEDINALRI